MKYLKFSSDLLMKKPIASLLMLAQLVLSVIAVNYSLATIQSISLNMQLIKKIPNANTFCVMPTWDTMIIEGEEYINYDDIKGKYEIGKAGYLFFNGAGFEGIKMHTYSDSLLKNIQVPLSRGSWDLELLIENGKTYYPVVINAEYPNLKYKDKLVVSNDESGTINMYVAAVLNEGQRYLSLNTTGNQVNSDYFFKTCFDDLEQRPHFFANEKYLPEFAKKHIFYQDTKFLFFKDTTPNSVLQDAEGILSNQAYTYTLSELLENSRTNYREHVRLYIPFCVFIVLISLCGIISLSALSMLQNIRYFATLSLCGCCWRNCVYICFGYLGLLCFVASAILGAFYSIGNMFGLFLKANLLFTNMNVVVTLLIFMVVLLFPIFIPWFMLKKHSASQLLRKFD